MQFKPHDYQQYAIRYIETNPIAAILLDMGLGKTVITLTAIQHLLYDSFEIHKVLVIAPLRVAKYSWPEELKKWEHLRNLRYSIVVGNREERMAALRMHADLYIVNRENVQWLVEDSSYPFDFDMLVVDELSSFKSYQAKRFRALMKVRPKVKQIVGLTGTPSSNGLMDLFAEFRLLDMGQRLGRYITRYREQYFQPDKRNAQMVFSYKPLPGAEEAIYQKLSDITISMRAIDHLQMPELLSNTYLVTLSEAEEKQYKELKKEMVLEMEGEEITVANAAALSNKLLQLANGAIYTDEKETRRLHERKLDALEDLLEAANGQPMLVAYWFKHDLERISERLTKLKVEYGALDQEKNIQQWNEGKLSVGLIHPASAGHGLNLQTGGSILVWFGLTWSLELYQQTNARLWRQGQRAKTVVLQHIVTKGTIDERVLKALENKNAVQQGMLAAVKAEVGLDG